MSTILVVDDEPVVRKLVAGILRRLGHRVVQATDGVEALAVLETTDVALIVTDVWMPRMDGADLGAAVSLRKPHIPVLYITGNPGDCVDRLRGQIVLTKPFHPQDLAGLVKQLLRESEASSHRLGS